MEITSRDKNKILWNGSIPQVKKFWYWLLFLMSVDGMIAYFLSGFEMISFEIFAWPFIPWI